MAASGVAVATLTGRLLLRPCHTRKSSPQTKEAQTINTGRTSSRLLSWGQSQTLKERRSCKGNQVLNWAHLQSSFKGAALKLTVEGQCIVLVVSRLPFTFCFLSCLMPLEHHLRKNVLFCKLLFFDAKMNCWFKIASPNGQHLLDGRIICCFRSTSTPFPILGSLLSVQAALTSKRSE